MFHPPTHRAVSNGSETTIRNQWFRRDKSQFRKKRKYFVFLFEVLLRCCLIALVRSYWDLLMFLLLILFYLFLSFFIYSSHILCKHISTSFTHVAQFSFQRLVGFKCLCWTYMFLLTCDVCFFSEVPSVT